MKKQKESSALSDVRAWKSACWRDVAHLSLERAIAKRLADATATAKRLGLLPDVAGQGFVPRVAEPGVTYRVKKRS